MSCLLSSSSTAAMVPPNCCWADRLLLAAHAYLRDSCFTTLNASGGTGAVALDNKIEQAMDLVKSHLMFAVREEVDVLKEKITELTERITQLEYENGVLRAHASPEVLSQLSGAPPTPCQAIPPSPGNPPSS